MLGIAVDECMGKLPCWILPSCLLSRVFLCFMTLNPKFACFHCLRHWFLCRIRFFVVFGGFFGGRVCCAGCDVMGGCAYGFLPALNKHRCSTEIRKNTQNRLRKHYLGYHPIGGVLPVCYTSATLRGLFLRVSTKQPSREKQINNSRRQKRHNSIPQYHGCGIWPPRQC